MILGAWAIFRPCDVAAPFRQTATRLYLVRLGPVVAGVGLSLGCADARQESCAKVASALYFGTPEAPTALTIGSQLAIGAIQDASGTTYCSATMVSHDQAVTATHCDYDEPSFFSTGATGSAQARARVIEWAQSPDASTSLLTLELNQALVTIAPTPIEIPAEPVPLDIDGRLTMAGFGLDETGSSGVRKFVSQAIVDFDEGRVVVDGKGESGACFGDSGGPLLTFESSEVRLLGVLNVGSESCVDIDVFVRLDTQSEWIRSNLHTSEDICNGLTREGRCDDNRATWCAAGKVHQDDCGNTRACSWQDREGGYRCALPPHFSIDPCGSVE